MIMLTMNYFILSIIIVNTILCLMGFGKITNFHRNFYRPLNPLGDEFCQTVNVKVLSRLRLHSVESEWFSVKQAKIFPISSDITTIPAPSFMVIYSLEIPAVIYQRRIGTSSIEIESINIENTVTGVTIQIKLCSLLHRELACAPSWSANASLI